MRGQFDPEDSVLAPVFLLFTAMQVDVAYVELFGFDFAQSLATVADLKLTIPFVGSMLILGTVYITNVYTENKSLQDLGMEYYVPAVSAPVLILLTSWVPALRDLSKSNDFVAIGLILIASAAYAAISYLS